MKKTILIPTDFSIESLMPVKYAVLANPDAEIDIVLMYCCFSSDSITGLLFYSPETIINGSMSFEFKEACLILENTYRSRITKLSIEVFHGLNGSAFDNFIKGNRINEAVFLENYNYKLQKNAFDPIPYIKKSRLGHEGISWQEEQHRDVLLFNLFIN